MSGEPRQATAADKVTAGAAASAVRREGRAFTVPATVAAFVAFVTIGATQALYGPAIPALRERFAISPSMAGLSLSAHFAGALAGVLVFAAWRPRSSNRRILAVSYLLLAVGAAGFALAASWPLALVAALVVGLGFGGVDYGINQVFAEGFGRRAAAMLNLLHAHFGIGAVLGPAALGWLSPSRYPAVFLACAVVGVALVPFVRGVGTAATTPRDRPALPQGQTLIAVFVVVYVLYVAIETGVGGWEATHLRSLGYSVDAAAAATSLYWLMLTIGRFLVAPLSLRWSAPTIVTASCLAMMALLALAAVPGLTLYAYAGVGLVIAPIFPTGLAWLSRAVPGIAGAIAYVIAAATFGGVAFPPLLGKVIEGFGVAYLPWVLVALAGLTALGVRWLARRTSRQGLGDGD